MRGLKWNKEMEKFKISQIEIMNFWKRKQEGQYMKKLIEISAKPHGIPVYLSYDDGSIGPYKNFKKALTEHSECDGTHRLVIHDDMTFERNVLDKIIYIMQRAPQDAFVSFYTPTNKVIENCNKHLLKSLTIYWMPCIAIPNNVVHKKIAEIERICKDEYKDILVESQFRAYLQETKTYFFTVVPGLVQHLGAYRSTLKIGGEVVGTPRNSSRYDNQLNVEGIDWVEEFKEPYEAEKSKDKIEKYLKK
jgi:hypothetical protein